MKILKIISILIIIAILGYGAAWYYMAQEAKAYIGQYYQVDGPATGIRFYGEEPTVSGFPRTPVITYKQGFEKDNILIYFDEMRVTGFPLPDMPMKIEARGNIKMVNQNVKMEMKADEINITFITPKSFPPSAKKQDIAHWQKEVGSVTITDANFKNSEVNIHGEGTVGLDENLQLATKLKTKTYGYERAIQFFIETENIEPFVGSLAISGLNSMAFKDPKTYEKYVEIDILIQDQEMFFGPIKIDSLPEIQWR